MKLRALLFAPLAIALMAAAPRRDDITRLRALTAEGMPRGLVTVVVPVPVDLRNEELVTFEVRAIGMIEVLGRRVGYAVEKGVATRPLVLTLRIPAGTEAGAYDGAEVYFRTREGREVIVPVSIRIGFVRAVSLDGPREMRGLRLGDRLELAYTITNSGNGVDSLQVDLTGPVGWPVRLAGHSRIEVPARGRVTLSVMVGVPGTANVGDHALSLSVRRQGSLEPYGTIHTTLGIVGRAGERRGLLLKPVVAVAAAAGQTAVFTGATLEGPISENTHIRVQFSPTTSMSGVAMQGLASVGASATPFNAYLAGQSWDAAAGNVGVQLSDLVGVNLIGEGVTTNISTDRYRARAIVARPGSGAQRQGGMLVGAAGSRMMSFGRLGFAASQLHERVGLGGDRRLTALGVEYTSHVIGSLTVGSGLAYRATEFEDGAGIALSLSHERGGERGGIRITHAPGGSGGFARATDEYQFDYAREIGRQWSMDAAAQYGNDEGAVFSAMRSTSWSLGTRYQPTAALFLSLRAADSRFAAHTADATGGDFGADNVTYTLAAEWRRDLLGLNVEGTLGTVGRTTELSSGALHRAYAGQRAMRAGASRAFERWGAVDATLGVEATGAGVGLPGQLFTTGVRWSNVPLTVLDRSIRLSTELNHQQLGSLQRGLVFRSNAVVSLRGGLDLALSAERNPYYRDAQGRPSWIFAMRVNAAARVRSADALGPQGVVFEDRNMNGTRDEGEPGIGGVTVRRGEMKARTATDGSYRLPLHARGVARIDQATLPIGLLPHPALAAMSIERLDLPVLPTGSAEMVLELVADADGRVPQVDLEPAVVILRDASGFEWVGRRASPTRVLFEGVPVGTYTLVFNGSRLREPLRAADRTVTITPGSSQQVTVELRGRVIRTFAPPSNSSPDGGTPRRDP